MNPELAQAILASAKRLADTNWEYRSLHALGEVERDLGNARRAAELLERSARLAREAGDRDLLTSIIHGSADLALPLPAALASRRPGEYIGVTVTGEHPSHPGWAAHPVTFSFRRTPGGWEAVGVSRDRRQEPPR